MEIVQQSMAMYPVNEQGGSVGKSMGCGGGVILTEEELKNQGIDNIDNTMVST